ncbi:hypothetical protein HF086_016519 [Spodoptera exigua]|uniref:DUF5641 domain-containing protein n=1 Tax=Spodoptera exigua TaxID=7107 RepID=A0A922ME51_SPOEX|nr:hypothetical protein HF086_016519 [Spodoptera exigua]
MRLSPELCRCRILLGARVNRERVYEPTGSPDSGDIVLVRDNNLPPGKWAMGRVLKLHPGADGYVRVTTLKTQNGVIKRPIVKLSILPINTDSKGYEESKADLRNAETSEKPPQEYQL